MRDAECGMQNVPHPAFRVPNSHVRIFVWFISAFSQATRRE